MTLEGTRSMSEQFSIFIFKSQASSLTQAETFLRNRNWTVESGTDLRQALAYIIQNQPQFVLITCDHPNRKVQALPRMLTQAFPLRVIGFAEKGIGHSIRKLQEMNIEYNLNPPVSGPAIVRMILKIRRDDELRNLGPASESQNFRSDGLKSSSDLITLKGEGLANAGSLDQARAALTRMMSAESGDEEAFPSVISQGESHSAKGPAYAGGPVSASPQMNETEEGLGSGKDPISSDGPEDEDSPQTSSRRSKNKTPIMESEYVPKPAHQPYRMTQEEKKGGRPNESIIVKGTQQVLEDTFFLKDPNPEIEKIGIASSLACITIRSPRFSGYLVCALAKNRKIDEALIAIIQKRLFAFLKANGEPVNEEDPLNIEVEEVNFTDWTVEQAEFLRNAVLDGSELSIAFFPNPQMEIRLEESVSSKMLKISMEDLKEDAPVEFDLYIFMPQNNKYLLFTAKGLPFYGHQKGRLLKRGITHMHIPKDSAREMKKYRAQNFFNDKIADFKKKKKKLG
jgi:hypothetical protein